MNSIFKEILIKTVPLNTINQDLPLHTHYEKSNLNPFFHKILSKPIPQWLLATETAMIKIYHTVYETQKENLTHLLISKKHTTIQDP